MYTYKKTKKHRRAILQQKKQHLPQQRVENFKARPSQEKAKITGMDLKVTKESMAYRDQKKAKTRARESETPHQNNPKWMFGIPAGWIIQHVKPPG